MKNKKDNETKKKIDLVIKIVLIIIIILLLIHNCSLLRDKDKYQNNPTPNGNVDVIEIKCDSGKCKPIVTPNTVVTPAPITAKKIESLSFAQKNISVVKGDTLGLVVTVKPTELSSSKLTWKSSDPSIVSVDSNGKIKALKEGKVTITVTSANGKMATCTVEVTVNNVDVKEIKLSVNQATIYVGALMQINATVEPENATNREIVWSSSNPRIATVDSNGIVKGIKTGNVTITAKTKDGKVTANAIINVENIPVTPSPTPIPTPMEITSLGFAQENVSVKKGNTLGLVVTVKPTELSSKLTWKSSDTSIVTIDDNGIVKGIKEGTATITVTSANGKTATCVVTVTTDTIPVEEIILSPSNINIKVGSTSQISAVVKPENATDRELVWTSSDLSIATVDNKGVVKGIKSGTVTITAKTKDGKVVATVTVTVENLPPTPSPTPTITPTPSPTPDSDKVEVFDNDYDPVTWDGSTQLKIFTKSMYNIDGVIAPESANTYEFIVRNSTDYNIKYNITFVETNNYHINMKYKLRKNDTYIIDHEVSYDELNLSNQLLGVDENDTYYLEWRWVSSSNDTSIGKNPDAKYGLQIMIEAESVNE